MIKYLLFLLSICSLATMVSCEKDTFISSGEARLRATTDTVKFDTVLTTVGSITKSFKLVNENSQKLKISSLTLMGGSASVFSINVNGQAGTSFTDIEMRANDSLYIFVKATVDPSAQNNPLLFMDSIRINYNGNTRYIQLQAYGQDAIFLDGQTISTNTTWSSAKPYVILGGLLVADGATLTIPANTKVYAHADAPIIIDGTLAVNGTKNQEVIFAGDRLDKPYSDYPAGWPGIYFRQTAKNNTINFAVIKNAYQAVVLLGPATNAAPKLTMQQTIIDNAYEIGLWSLGSSFALNNNLISNCGSAVGVQGGGTYSMVNCTLTGYSTRFIRHSTPALFLTNEVSQNGNITTAPLSATITNTIIWGDGGLVEDELQVIKKGNNPFSVVVENTLYRAKTDPANTTFANVIKNIAPQFDSVDINRSIYYFRISSPSAPGINKGKATSFLRDLDNAPRSVGLPDMGCYELQ